MTLIDALCYGRSSAQTKAELAAALSTTTRAVEAEIEALRKEGRVAIASASEGYWRPLTVEEYQANVQSRRSRALSQLVTVRGERRLIRRWKASVVEQGTLWDAA